MEPKKLFKLACKLLLIWVIVDLCIFIWKPFSIEPQTAELVSSVIGGLSVLIVAFIVAKSDYLSVKGWKKKVWSVANASAWTAFVIVIAVGASLGILNGIFTTSVAEETVFIDKNSDEILYIVDASNGSQRFWDSDPLIKTHLRLSYQTDTKGIRFTGPHSVTVNPKVRNIFFDIEVETLGDLEAFKKHYRHVRSMGGTKEWLTFWLYEFNEKRSKEIAFFSNPKRPEQQREFSFLFKKFMEDKLKKSGTRITKAKFYIPGEVFTPAKNNRRI